MKKKNFNLNLAKSLINSDFLLLEKKKTKQKHNSRFENLNISFGKQQISFLDPLETLKTLKQMIRLFYFAKNSKTSRTDLHFFLDDENTIMSYLMKTLLDNELVKSQVFFDINGNSNNSNFMKKKQNFQISFVLDKQVSKEKNFMKKQFYKNNYLFFKINSNLEKTQNSYKIYNNFDDYKKILFFIGLLKQILTKSYNTKSFEPYKYIYSYNYQYSNKFGSIKTSKISYDAKKKI